MSNKRFDEINIPENIDNVIEKGVAKALKEQKAKKNSLNKNLYKIAVASLVGVLAIGVANPAMASKIPFVGNVFEAIEKNIYFPGNYSQYATSVNEKVYSNGIGITLSEIVCDGQALYVTYVVENKEPFKYTSWENGKKLDMNQLITEEAYNKVDFSEQELDTSGFAGLEGKFIDEYTFVGVQKYDMSGLKEAIPDEFTFTNKIVVVQNYAINVNDKDDNTWGTWAFKVPVKVNKNLRKVTNFDNVENDTVKINSVSITPFDMIIKAYYKKGTWQDYRYNIYDENGKLLNMSKSGSEEDDRHDKLVYEAPNKGCKSLRIVVEKPILKEISSKPGVYEEVGYDTVFDEIVTLDK